MRKTAGLFMAGLVAVCAMAPGALARCKVDDLRCEYLVNPLGIDAAQPRLSWILDSKARGEVQTAYQVLVASTRAALNDNKGDRWDSGKVASDQSVQVVYAGSPLASRDCCFWKVRVWDKDGKASPWSDAASWTMGLLAQEDWKGQWIGCDWMADNTGTLPWFRKEFTVTGKPGRAMAYVCALGYYEIFVNGRKVDDYIMAPATSDYGKRGLYITHDISGYLRPGANCVGLWLGRGWSTAMLKNASTEGPFVRAQIEFDHAGGNTVVATGADWAMHPSSITPLGRGASGDYGGEQIDARLDTLAWSEAGYNADDWKPARVASPPTPIVSAQIVEPNRIFGKLEPRKIEPLGNAYLVDMGRNYSGWFVLNLPDTLAPGCEIKIQYADKRFPDGRMQCYNQRDVYIARGGGETFCNRFNYHSFRWALVEGLPRAPKASEITGLPISTDYDPAASFTCSNPLLNDIYNTILWTYRALSLGGYTVDCPHRERLGYGGDSGTSMECGMVNFRLGAFYSKWAADWRDSQNAEGDVPYVAPCPHGAGGGPVWSGFCITMPWQVYIQYGDERLLETAYPTMQRWLSFIETKERDGLLEHYVGIGNADPTWSYLGDWVPPGREQGGDRVDELSTRFFNNCYYVHCLQLASRTAAVIGKNEDAAKYAAKAKELAARVHERFLNAGEATYVNREQPYLAMPLLFNVTPREMQPQVMAALENDILVARKGHLNTGMHGTYYMVKHFINQGRNDLVYTIVNKDTYPSWGYMLKNGATTIWEEWDGENSQIHNTLISVGLWFIEGLGGIRTSEDAPGYKHILVTPGVVGDLTHAAASQRSPYGDIASEWRRDGEHLSLKVTIPPNSDATLIIPAAGPGSVTEGRKPLESQAGINHIQYRDGKMQCRVAAGRYEFESRMK